VSEVRTLSELEDPMLDACTWVDAGAVRFGIERRVLPAPAAERRGLKEPVYGVCIHVFDVADGRERLRFDCFDIGSHYHYLRPDEQVHEFVVHDAVANGPMLPWALAAMRQRLQPMLEHASAVTAARNLDTGEVEMALPRVQQLAERALREPGT
jgi:hypothetical protein